MDSDQMVRELAEAAAQCFERRTREDGSRFTACKDVAPEWVRELVMAAHDGHLPDDWRYECVANALEFIASAGDDLDDAGFEFADDVDVYNSDLLTWLASNSWRSEYCDEAEEEYGAAVDGSIIARIARGQYLERSEVFGLVLQSLRARAEDVQS